MSSPELVVHADPSLLAAAVAARFITRLIDVQSVRGSASVVLTGGGIGIAMLEQVRDSPARDAVDWTQVDVWWGDERFVPAEDSDRNDGQARAALLSAVPLNPARVHPFPASDSGLDVDAAAALFAAELGSARFDVLLLGVGEEGHVASIFPHSPAAYDERLVCAVRDCPKPPPTRISLGFTAICSAREVWLVAAGAGKAAPLAAALSGAARTEIPAAGALGAERTLWLLDRAATGT